MLNQELIKIVWSSSLEICECTNELIGSDLVEHTKSWESTLDDDVAA